MAEAWTEKQGQYLAFSDNYSVMFGQAPAEGDVQRFFGTSVPTIQQMLKTLVETQLISRVPGKACSIALLIEPEAIPRLVRPGRSNVLSQRVPPRSGRLADQIMKAPREGGPRDANSTSPAPGRPFVPSGSGRQVVKCPAAPTRMASARAA